MEKTISSFDGIKINYDIERIGRKNKVIILLHGLGGNLMAWDKPRKIMRGKGFSTLAMDFRGHGKSGHPPSRKDYDFIYFAQDLHEIIKQEKIRKFILVGHCFGGMVAATYHKLYPDHALAYVLVDTTDKAPAWLHTLFSNPHYFKDMLFNYLERNDTQDSEQGKIDYARYINTGDLYPPRIYADISSTTFRSWLFTYDLISTYDGTDVLKTINQKVLVVVGKDDSIFGVETSIRLKGLIRDSELEVIPNANHVITLNSPEELADRIAAFSSRIKGFA